MNDSELLKNIRYELRLTQGELGEKVGASKQYISNIENGTRPLSKNITASAGAGHELTQECENVSISTLQKIGYSKFDNLVIVKISGVSMQPTINNVDMLVVDTNFEKVEDNQIYVINYGGSLFCKRLLCGLTYVKIKSDNPEYDVEKIEGQESEKLNIIGRVVFRMNKV